MDINEIIKHKRQKLFKEKKHLLLCNTETVGDFSSVRSG